MADKTTPANDDERYARSGLYDLIKQARFEIGEARDNLEYAQAKLCELARHEDLQQVHADLTRLHVILLQLETLAHAASEQEREERVAEWGRILTPSHPLVRALSGGGRP